MHAAIKRLKPLGIGKPDAKAARNIGRHMVAAEREAVDIGEIAAGKMLTVVVPPPMSIRAAPSSASSSASVERPAA